MSSPGTIQQEMTRILTKMRGQGVKYAWLSEENLKAMQNRPGQFLAQQQPAAIPQINQSQPTITPPQQAVSPAPPQTQYATPQRSSTMQQSMAQPPQPQPVQTPVAKPPTPTIDPKLIAEFSASVKNTEWSALVNISHDCTLCGLSATCKHKLFYTGAQKVRVLFVGDFPTVEEDEIGAPFSGQAGQMLFKMGKAMGLDWSENAKPQNAAGYANVLKCRPSVVPSEMQLSACLPILQRQIELLSPDTLVLLGAIPTKMLTGKSGFNKLKGTWDTYLGLPAAIIQSPSVIVRFAKQQSIFLQERRQAWATLQEVMNSLLLGNTL